MLDSTPKFVVTAYLTLNRNETFRIPPEYHKVQVVAGIAWLTIEGSDLVLTPGETACLLSRDPVVVSVLGQQPLELLAWQQEDSPSSPPDKPSAPSHSPVIL
ncbi:hypothetical protein [Leptolyngbya sp. 'hensonii']|uniref:hypothetical protein n=1 Tax=Leptolyngbya sp. 'hensonii' TaxID=1922337 RepID=UPI00117E0844|nr:hypothetical protein [Leptolyngbya sp. 'hensonii']